MKVLVIENQIREPAYVNTLRSSVIITNIDYTSDPEKGLEMLKTNRYDFLILEMILAGTDGFEILSEIRKSKNLLNLRIFVLTYVFDDCIIRQAFQLGITHYLIKPINADLLQRRIERSQMDATWLERFEATMEKKPVLYDSNTLDNLVPNMLKLMGTNPKLAGYRYLIHAIKLAILDSGVLCCGMTKTLYPAVAKEFSTTPSRVERAIRHAIERTWDACQIEIIIRIFGNSVSPEKGRPTNSEFIATLCDYIRTVKNPSEIIQ